MKLWLVLIGIIMSGTSAASGAMAGAGGTVGTADAFHTLFLRPVDVEYHQSQNQDNNGDHKDINGIHGLLLSGEGVFRLDLLIRIGAQIDQDAHHDNHGNQAACKSCTQMAFGD